MELLKTYAFLEQKKDFLFPNDEFSDEDIQNALLAAPDDFEYNMNNIPLRDPKIVQIISVFPGSLGVDRFYIGDIKKGLLKYITFGGLGVWWISDIISAKNRCRVQNCKKLIAAINDPSVATTMNANDDKVKKAFRVAKAAAPVVKSAAKGLKDIGNTFGMD